MGIRGDIDNPNSELAFIANKRKLHNVIQKPFLDTLKWVINKNNFNLCVPTSHNTLRSHWNQIWCNSDYESELQAIGSVGHPFLVRLYKTFNFKF